MPDGIVVIREAERPVFSSRIAGGDFRPIIDDDNGEGVSIRTGILTQPPGSETRVHSHPYVETLTVMSGRGEAWIDGEPDRVALEPGVTLLLPAHRMHAFRVVGDEPLVTLGIHTFGKRIVNFKDTGAIS
jgi:quercetin dioxygenase-like cupin family protein